MTAGESVIFILLHAARRAMAAAPLNHGVGRLAVGVLECTPRDKHCGSNISCFDGVTQANAQGAPGMRATGTRPQSSTFSESSFYSPCPLSASSLCPSFPPSTHALVKMSSFGPPLTRLARLISAISGITGSARSRNVLGRRLGNRLRICPTHDGASLVLLLGTTKKITKSKDAHL